MVRTGTELHSEEKGRGQLHVGGEVAQVEYAVRFYQDIGKPEAGAPSIGIELHAGEGKILSKEPSTLIPLDTPVTLVLSDGRKVTVRFKHNQDGFEVEGPVK